MIYILSMKINIGYKTSWGMIRAIKDNIVSIYNNGKLIDIDMSLVSWDISNTMSKTKMVFNTTIKQLKPIT